MSCFDTLGSVIVSTSRPRSRSLGVATAATGALGLCLSPRVAQLAGGSGSIPPDWIVRLLSGRYLIQGAIECLRPTRRVLLACSLTDGLHATSMFMVASAWPSYRRPSLISAGIAILSATAAASRAGTSAGRHA